MNVYRNTSGFELRNNLVHGKRASHQSLDCIQNYIRSLRKFCEFFCDFFCSQTILFEIFPIVRYNLT